MNAISITNVAVAIRWRLALFLCLMASLVTAGDRTAQAEDGYRLWLRYDALPAASAEAYRPLVETIVGPESSSTLKSARDELVQGCTGLLSRAVTGGNALRGGSAVVIGTPTSSALIAGLKLDGELSALGADGFLIRSVKLGNASATVIASSSDAGVLYGAFHFLRLMQTLQPIGDLQVQEKPRFGLRVLNHWDNLNGSVERGYAGKSLWKWDELPGTLDPRVRDYARANASLGINGTVINNVNASAKSLSAEYLPWK